MYRLRISKFHNGNYIVSDYNDERLRIIGQILADPKVRKFFAKHLEHISLGLDKTTYETKSVDNKITFKFKDITDEYDKYKLFITVTEDPNDGDPEMDHKFETDIEKEMLKDIIDDFEDLISQEVQEIVIVRYQDNFRIEPSDSNVDQDIEMTGR